MSQRRFRVFLLSAFLSVAPGALGQTSPVDSSTPAISAKPVTVIPFKLYHNRVYLPVRVNGSGPYTMILDTGAAETFVSESVAEEVKLPHKGSVQVNGNGEGVERFPLAKNVNFGVGDAALREKMVVIYNYGDLERHEGRTIDGTLGVNFFHKYVVEIDYAARKLRVYDPATFSCSGPATVVSLRVVNGGTVALFDAKIVGAAGQQTMYARLAVDSGTYSALRLFRPFVEKNKLVGEGRNQFASYGFGAGGEFRQVTGRIESLDVAGVKILNPVADFSTDTKGVTASANYDGTIGGDILRRFRVILDYSRQQMILEPNVDFATPFDTDKSGERPVVP